MAKKLAPVHPGEVLREEFLKPLKLTPYAVAASISVPRTRIERLARFGLQGCFAQRPCHAACSRPSRARRDSIAANASKIARICGGL